jgi:hypothetical protein
MKTALPLLCLLTLAACSGKPPEPQAAPNAGGQASAASVATPWDALKQDEQRAKDVQKIVDKQAKQQAQQIEQQTQ